MTTLRRPYTFDRVVRMIITALVIIGAILLIRYLKDVLLPFCVSCLIAYILEPFVQYNRRLLGLKGRAIAVFITLFEALFLFATLCALLVPRIIDEMHQLAQIMQTYSESAPEIAYLPGEIHKFIQEHINFEELADMLTKQEGLSILEGTLSTFWGIISSGFSILIGVLNWCLVILYVIFIMIDYERLNITLRRMVPPKYRKRVFRIGNDIKVSMNHYFRGQALIALSVGILFSIGFTIIGLPMGILMGLFIGLLNMVPYLQLISIIPTVLLCLVNAAAGGDFWTTFWECMALYCIVQAIQDLILTPKIMGKFMGLNPAIILLSLSIWGTLLGMIGLIIALPLTTLLLSYYDEYIINRHDGESHQEKTRDKALIDSLTHFPDDPAETL